LVRLWTSMSGSAVPVTDPVGLPRPFVGAAHAAVELQLAEMVILRRCHLAHAGSANQLRLLFQALCSLVLLPVL
jgi:hypothetical protein